jgi:hypothetical protein
MRIDRAMRKRKKLCDLSQLEALQPQSDDSAAHQVCQPLHTMAKDFTELGSLKNRARKRGRYFFSARMMIKLGFNQIGKLFAPLPSNNPASSVKIDELVGDGAMQVGFEAALPGKIQQRLGELEKKVLGKILRVLDRHAFFDKNLVNVLIIPLEQSFEGALITLLILVDEFLIIGCIHSFLQAASEDARRTKLSGFNYRRHSQIAEVLTPCVTNIRILEAKIKMKTKELAFL